MRDFSRVLKSVKTWSGVVRRKSKVSSRASNPINPVVDDGGDAFHVFWTRDFLRIPLHDGEDGLMLFF